MKIRRGENHPRRCAEAESWVKGWMVGSQNVSGRFFSSHTTPKNSWRVDPNLTLTRTQCSAIAGKAGNREPVFYARFANPCNAQKRPIAHP